MARTLENRMVHLAIGEAGIAGVIASIDTERGATEFRTETGHDALLLVAHVARIYERLTGEPGVFHNLLEASGAHEDYWGGAASIHGWVLDNLDGLTDPDEDHGDCENCGTPLSDDRYDCGVCALAKGHTDDNAG